MIDKLTIFYMEKTIGTMDIDRRTPTFVFPMNEIKVAENFNKLTIKKKEFVLRFVSNVLGYDINSNRELKYHHTGYIQEGAMLWQIPELSTGTIQAIGVATALVKETKTLCLKYPEVGIHHLSVRAIGKIMLGIANRSIWVKGCEKPDPIKKIYVETRNPMLIEGFDRSTFLHDAVKSHDLYYFHGRNCKRITVPQFEKENNCVKRKTNGK